MKKPSHRELLLEIASLLVVFTAAFLVGESATSRTGTVWWGISAGSLTFLGIFYAIIQAVHQFCPPLPDLSTPQTKPAEAAASPGRVELAGFLVIFLVGYLVGHLTFGSTGHVGWGILAGSLTMAGLVVALTQISSRCQALEPSSAPSSPTSRHHELAWAEPRGFRKTDLEEARKWVLKMVFLTVGIAAVLLCVAGWFEFEAEFTRQLLLTMGGIVALLLCLFGFTKLMRVGVKIMEEAIVRESADTSEVYRLESIDHCEIANMLVGSQMYSVLVVALKRGDREIFCVDPSVSTQILRTTLEQRAVNVVIRSDTMSEQALEHEGRDSYSPA